jgi:hypothetical protein
MVSIFQITIVICVVSAVVLIVGTQQLISSQTWYCDNRKKTDLVNSDDVKNANYNACIAKGKQNIKWSQPLTIYSAIPFGIFLVIIVAFLFSSKDGKFAQLMQKEL